MFDDGACFKIETAFARVARFARMARAETTSGRSPEPKAELLAKNRKGDRSRGFLVLRVFGSGLKRPVRLTQTLMQAPALRVTLANQRGGGSNGAAQHANGDGFDAGPDAKALLRPLDVEMRGRRLDADQDGDVGIRFAGRRPLQALDLARAELHRGRVGHAKTFRCTAAFPHRARHRLQCGTIGDAELQLVPRRHCHQALQTARTVDRNAENVLPAVGCARLVKLFLLGAELKSRNNVSVPERTKAPARFDGQYVMLEPTITFIEVEPVRRPVDEEKAGLAVSPDPGPGAAGRAGKPHALDRRQEIGRRRGRVASGAAFDELQSLFGWRRHPRPLPSAPPSFTAGG